MVLQHTVAQWEVPTLALNKTIITNVENGGWSQRGKAD